VQQPFRAELFEPQQPLLAFQVSEQALLNGVRRQAQGVCYLLKDGSTMEVGMDLSLCAGTLRFTRAGSGGSAEDQLPQLLGRMSGNHFELAAVFEQLGQALMDELGRIIAEGFAEFVFQLAAGMADLFAEQIEQLLGDFQPGGVAGVDVNRNDPVAGKTDPDQSAGEHGALVSLPAGHHAELFYWFIPAKRLGSPRFAEA
jgi:hypothetical protein